MSRSGYLPNINRISVLTASILLTYTITQFVDFPTREISLQLPGIFLSIEINARILIGVLVVALTATGTDWLLRDHPKIGNKSTFQHWILPSLTAWGLGLSLYQLPFGTQWLLVFVVGGGLLVTVLIAEFIVVDPKDAQRAPAAIGLSALSFAFYLVLSVTLRSALSRLFLILPPLALATMVVSLRTLHLRLQGYWAFTEAAIITIITCQVVTALHYLPLSPISYGLIVFGPVYALTGLSVGMIENISVRKIIVEPFLVLLVIWGTALWTI